MVRSKTKWPFPFVWSIWGGERGELVRLRREAKNTSRKYERKEKKKDSFAV